MKETPILMCGEMVRATLADLKTETRRVAKPFHMEAYGMGWCDKVWEEKGLGFCGEWDWRNPYTGEKPRITSLACPYGAPGDRLWVRETFLNNALAGYDPVYFYRADDPEKPSDRHWKPSIFMPRRASRITLEITGIRAERVQDITAAGAIAEGIGVDDGQMRETPNFRELWDSLNARRDKGIYAWVNNPWVWVLQLKRVPSVPSVPSVKSVVKNPFP